MSKFQWKKIEEHNDMRIYIINGLKNHQNPDEISGRMKKEKQPFYASKTSVYEWLRSYRGQYYCRYLYSQRYAVKRRGKNKTARVMIPERVSIDRRFWGQTTGHDTAIGKKTRWFPARDAEVLSLWRKKGKAD